MEVVVNTKLITGIIGAFVVVGLAGVMFVISQPQRRETTPLSGTSSASSQAAQPTADSPTIRYTDEGFQPETSTVKAGTVIRIVNSSSSILQFSSGSHPSHLEDPELNMGTLQPAEEGSVTAKTIGTHTFHDHFNAGNSGTLIVTE